MRTHPSFRPTCFDSNEQIQTLMNGGTAFFEQNELVYNPLYANSLECCQFQEKKIFYTAKFQHKNSLGKRPVGIIPIRDNVALIEYTLNNLSTNKVFECADFIVVDDQSQAENSHKIQGLCDQHNLSYLHISNGGLFNFSMMNNIAAALAKAYGAKHIILWNADLWAPNAEMVPEILRRFYSSGAKAAGTKLVYPPFEWSKNEQNSNRAQLLASLAEITSSTETLKFLNNYRGTVQFAGGAWYVTKREGNLFPAHYGLFRKPEDIRVNQDYIVTLLTGAFSIFDLDWFIKIDGLNPSLRDLYQDVEFSLKAMWHDEPLYYFGKDVYLYHEHSPCISLYPKQSVENWNSVFTSEKLLWAIWPESEKARLITGNGARKLVE